MPTSSVSRSVDLHVFFLPFLAPGHMIPMVDLARLFASRGARASIVTTTANVARIQHTVDLANAGATLPHPIQILALRFPSAAVGLPEGYENVASLRDPEEAFRLMNGASKLETPLHHLLGAHRPDCLVADIYYPWTNALAREFGIPRLCFHGSSCFFYTIGVAVAELNLGDTDQPFELPSLPRIKFNPVQIPDYLTHPNEPILRMIESARECHGTVMNSFYDLEREYIDLEAKAGGAGLWCVGPVSLHTNHEAEKTVRGSDASDNAARCLKWLDGKMRGSVLYLCFGSQSRFTAPQLHEIARGLEACKRPFVWVVRNAGEPEEWMPEAFEKRMPEGFEERMLGQGKGLIVRGWAPQLLMLNHEAVGGFVTHCGWNSCIEAVGAGVPVLTWPLFADQFINEKLLVQIHEVGVAIGVTVCRDKAEEREFVKGERVKEAVEELMGEGKEAEERRKRARELAEMARKAMEGGSSHTQMNRLLENLISLKAIKSNQKT